MLKQPACPGLLPVLTPVRDWSSSALAGGCPLRGTQLPARLSSGVMQGRCRPSLCSTPLHYRLTSNPHISVAFALVQAAGSGPAGLEVQNDHLRIQRGSQVPSRVPAPLLPATRGHRTGAGSHPPHPPRDQQRPAGPAAARAAGGVWLAGCRLPRLRTRPEQPRVSRGARQGRARH